MIRQKKILQKGFGGLLSMYRGLAWVRASQNYVK